MAYRLFGEDRHGDRMLIPVGGKPARVYQIGKERPDYRATLRAAVSEILGSGPNRIHVMQGSRRIAICELQDRKVGRRGQKMSVRCYGDKPRKQKR